MSCSSKMPLPRASIRLMARRWRNELHLGEAGFRPVAKTPLDAAETDPVIFSGMGGVVSPLARGAAAPSLTFATAIYEGLFSGAAARPQHRRFHGLVHGLPSYPRLSGGVAMRA
jgi:hypothetical protein